MECGRGDCHLGICSICMDRCFCECFSFFLFLVSLCSNFGLWKILCVIPVPVVRWVLVGVAFGLSGYFLVMNIYPIIANVGTFPFTLENSYLIYRQRLNKNFLVCLSS